MASFKIVITGLTIERVVPETKGFNETERLIDALIDTLRAVDQMNKDKLLSTLKERLKYEKI